jgi:hypothetical protein
VSQENAEIAKALMRNWSEGTDPGDLGVLELFRRWRGAWATISGGKAIGYRVYRSLEEALEAVGLSDS